jgi:hypothetical protein
MINIETFFRPQSSNSPSPVEFDESAPCIENSHVFTRLGMDLMVRLADQILPMRYEYFIPVGLEPVS